MAKKRAVRYAWLKIKDDIQDNILAGNRKPGDRIPTVAELAAKHGTSTTTVRQAIDELSSEGVLEVRQGRGTIVAPPKLEYDPFRGFLEQASELRGTANTIIHKTQWLVPHAETVKALGLRKGQQVWEVTRFHYLDDEPIMVEVTEFPKKFAEKFMGESEVLGSMFENLQAHLGHDDWEVDVMGLSVTTERVYSDLLEIPRRTTFYHLERVVSNSGEPLYVSFLVLRSDKFRLSFRRDSSDGKTGK
jgi:DNA-binding GntR family transcriptional regulator